MRSAKKSSTHKWSLGTHVSNQIIHKFAGKYAFITRILIWILLVIIAPPSLGNVEKLWEWGDVRERGNLSGIFF